MQDRCEFSMHVQRARPKRDGLAKELLGLDEGSRPHCDRAQKREAARLVSMFTKVSDDDVRGGLETAFCELLLRLVEMRVCDKRRHRSAICVAEDGAQARRGIFDQ